METFWMEAVQDEENAESRSAVCDIISVIQV
jgi:hypothetical protein